MSTTLHDLAPYFTGVHRAFAPGEHERYTGAFVVDVLLSSGGSLDLTDLRSRKGLMVSLNTSRNLPGGPWITLVADPGWHDDARDPRGAAAGLIAHWLGYAPSFDRDGIVGLDR